MAGFEELIRPDDDAAMQKMYSLDFASNKQLVKQQVARAVANFGKAPGDTGSTQVQVAVLSSKIESLALHCNDNRQDKHGR
jgi:small subunit ribosomal protein S15